MASTTPEASPPFVSQLSMMFPQLDKELIVASWAQTAGDLTKTITLLMSACGVNTEATKQNDPPIKQMERLKVSDNPPTSPKHSTPVEDPNVQPPRPQNPSNAPTAQQEAQPPTRPENSSTTTSPPAYPPTQSYPSYTQLHKENSYPLRAEQQHQQPPKTYVPHRRAPPPPQYESPVYTQPPKLQRNVSYPLQHNTSAPTYHRAPQYDPNARLQRNPLSYSAPEPPSYQEEASRQSYHSHMNSQRPEYNAPKAYGNGYATHQQNGNGNINNQMGDHQRHRSHSHHSQPPKAGRKMNNANQGGWGSQLQRFARWRGKRQGNRNGKGRWNGKGRGNMRGKGAWANLVPMHEGPSAPSGLFPTQNPLTRAPESLVKHPQQFTGDRSEPVHASPKQPQQSVNRMPPKRPPQYKGNTTKKVEPNLTEVIKANLEMSIKHKEQSPAIQAQLSAEQKNHFVSNGYVVINSAVQKALIDNARRCINMIIGSGHSKFDKTGLKFPPPIYSCDAISDLILRSSALPLIRSLVGDIHAPGGGDIRLNFPGQGCFTPAQFRNQIVFSGDGLFPKPEWSNGWILDGMSSPHNKIPPNTFNNYTLFCAVFLTDLPRDFSGNMAVFPGTHVQLQRFFNENGGPTNTLKSGIKKPTLDVEPKHILAKAGDILLCHYQLARISVPNTSPDVRYMVYFRLYNSRHNPMTYKEEAMTNIWLDYQGVMQLQQ